MVGPAAVRHLPPFIPETPVAARSGEESRVEPYLAMANLFDLLVFVCKENSESELSKSLIGYSVCYWCQYGYWLHAQVG